jgi:hypothetical protein
VRVEREPSEWIRTEAPHLRIVDDELWFAVQAKLHAGARHGYARKAGRPARHLLSDFLRCGECGGPASRAARNRSVVLFQHSRDVEA